MFVGGYISCDSSVFSIYVTLYFSCIIIIFFLAAIGGIFGLCLGGSIISIIELFYYIVTYWTCKQSTSKVISVKKTKPSDNDRVNIRVLYPVFEYTP